VSLLSQEPPPNVLASDSDRERTVTILRNESVSGRLSADELSSRLDKAFAAKTLGDLRALIADLPEGNVNPLNDLISGAVNTGMTVFRVGLWLTIGAVVVGVFAPIIAGLAATGHSGAALVATGLLVAVIVFGSARLRRRRPRPTE
jgi:Domain of unknown function (DUF1707)